MIPPPPPPAPCSAQSERDKIQEDRRLLPIYPYRDELLKAVEEHQVTAGRSRRTRARARTHTHAHTSRACGVWTFGT